jgi:hypothetical protein
MLYCPPRNTIHSFAKLTTGQENIMGQYRLWLHHRTIDQDLRDQLLTHKRELSEVDEHIACLEKTAMPTNNALLSMLTQQFKLQEHTTSNRTDTTATQLALNGTPQENTHIQNYQTPPPSNYGLQGNIPQTADPGFAPRPPHVYPGLLAWGHLPNFSTQDIRISEAPSADSVPLVPATTDHPLPSDLHTLLDPESQVNERLPWWLRNLVQSPPEEQEPQQTHSTDEQRIHTNQHIEHWFARRTRLIHYDK